MPALPPLRPWSAIRLALVALCACLLAFAPVAARAADWVPTDDDAWLFDLRSGTTRLGEGVRGYAVPGGYCVDLADVIIALDLPVRVDKKLRRATGWTFDERRPLTIDRDAGEVRLAHRVDRLTPDTIRDTPEGWCVATAALSAWLGVTLTPDPGNSMLILESREKLPFQLAAERRARAAGIRPAATFDLATLPQVRRPYAAWQTPSVDVVASLSVTRNKSMGSVVQRRVEAFAAGEVANASFDARFATDQRGNPESLRLHAYRVDPTGGLLGGLRATYAGVGDVSMLSTGLVAQAAPGRGAVVTNRPPARPDTFDRTDFRGDLPDGWDAELYRNGELLGFAQPNGSGRYEFLRVPLRYGLNRFEIVLYGPQGQVRRDVQTLNVGIDSIPPGQTYWWAGAAEENRDLIGLNDRGTVTRTGWRGTVGMERGIDQATGIAAYAHTLRIDNVQRFYGEAAIRRAIGASLIEIAGAGAADGGTAVRAQWLGEWKGAFLRAEANRGWNGFTSNRLYGRVNGLYELSVDPTFRLGRTVVPMHFDLRHITRSGGFATTEAEVRSSLAFRRIVLTGGLEWRRQAAPSGADPPADLAATLLANARFGRVRLRGEARFAVSGPANDTRMTLVADWAGGNRSEWRTEVGYTPGDRRARAALGYTRRFDRFLVSGVGEVASDGAVAASIGLSFSLGPRPGGGVRMTANRVASHGQVEALVWRDRNGDGVRQDDEPGVPGIQLTAGMSAAEHPTDARGYAVIDTLEPHHPVIVGIDTSAMSDPYVQSGVPGVVVTPRAGVVTHVALPLVSAGEIDGTLVRHGGGPLDGVRLELVDGDGRVRATTISEYDGFFLFEGVAYGRYVVRIARGSAATARLDAGFTVAATLADASPRVRLGRLAIAPLGPPLAEASK